MPRTMIGQQTHALRTSKHYEDFHAGRALACASLHQHQRTTPEGSGSGDLANTGAVRVSTVFAGAGNSYSKGHNGATWARVLHVEPRGRRADAGGRCA
jgi:hypothetical protein